MANFHEMGHRRVDPHVGGNLGRSDSFQREGGTRYHVTKPRASRRKMSPPSKNQIITTFKGPVYRRRWVNATHKRNSKTPSSPINPNTPNDISPLQKPSGIFVHNSKNISLTITSIVPKPQNQTLHPHHSNPWHP